MSMPSLPPALKPWMMRPRAGQRNSGLDPEASASAEVTGALAAAAFGSTLPVGVSSTPGFLAVALGTSVLATSVLPSDFSALPPLATSVLPFSILPGSVLATFSDLVLVAISCLALRSSAFAFSSALALSAPFSAPCPRPCGPWRACRARRWRRHPLRVSSSSPPCRRAPLRTPRRGCRRCRPERPCACRP